MDEAVERFREYFGGNENKLNLKIENIFRKVNSKETIPYATVRALEVLISKLLDGKLERPIAVVSGVYHPRAHMKKVYGKTKRKKRSYHFNLGNKTLSLGSYPYKKNETLSDDFRVHVTWGSVSTLDVLVGDIHRELRRKTGRSGHIYSNGVRDIDLFDFSRINLDKFSNSVGVAVKKIDTRGYFEIGETHFYLGPDYISNYVVAFFTNGKTFFFDAVGKKVKQSLPIRLYHADKIEQKVNKIVAHYKNYDEKSFSRRCINYMSHMWATKPFRFSSRYGRRLLVSGSYDSVVGNNFGAQLRHYYGNNLKWDLFTNKNYAGKTVNLSWRGHYVIIKNGRGETINAHALMTPGFEMLKPANIYNLEESITIRDLGDNFRSEIGISGTTYRFRMPDIRGALLPYSPSARKAILAHTFSDERRNSFYLLVDDGVKVHKSPLPCTNAIIRN
ncbi:hypothetical protein HN695_04285 [Candidatus Woesearchaeota archaeon]|jgi:hypothetical protein|nr:hypothetical protein [Candidatus Woesearchaeota archaeon]MBT5272368.1 hypothetical protein [Candidatus Woesearchaeota archaeon]MBT6040597.1 hypothetical protein [Candidatus Woesearchaeota archaeon]MBT6336640.1 hypothetical protein [Candidatus Woesearchaeota archaeon]MBT7927530.1 hypothetical protein [Candidatus Woesearchaeota archaeon]